MGLMLTVGKQLKKIQPWSNSPGSMVPAQKKARRFVRNSILEDL